MRDLTGPSEEPGSLAEAARLERARDSSRVPAAGAAPLAGHPLSPGGLLALGRFAGNAAVARLVSGTGGHARSFPPGLPLQRQPASKGRAHVSAAAEREQRKADTARVLAEHLASASEDLAKRQAERRANADDINYAMEMADGLTKTQADEARLLVGYPVAAGRAVQARDFELAQEHNNGFVRASASFMRTRDLTTASTEALAGALESSHEAGAMLLAFTQRRTTTLASIQQRILSAAGNVRYVANNFNEATYAPLARQFEQTHPTAGPEEKERNRREWGAVSREQESDLRDSHGVQLDAAASELNVDRQTPDLTDIHRICVTEARTLAELAGRLSPKAAGQVKTAAGELRQAAGMLAVLINPRRAAQALRALLFECQGSVVRMIGLPRRHDPTMPPGPDNPAPHRFRPRGLEAEPNPAPVDIRPL